MKQRTLYSVLEHFQKPELQDLGNLLGSDLSPRLRKSQLVEQLLSYLQAEPRRWMSHLMERDIRLLRDLVHAGPERIQYLDYAVYPSVLEVSGIVEYDDSDEHFHKVWISREVYEIVAPDIEKVIRSGEKSGQYELERIGLGYLNLYGILPTDLFQDRVLDWFERRKPGSDVRELIRLLHASPLMKICRFVDVWGDYLCSPCVENPEEIFELRRSLHQEQYEDALTDEEAFQAGAGAPYFTVGLLTREGMALEQLYRRLGYTGFDLVKAEHDTWMEAQYTHSPNPALYEPLLYSPQAQQLNRASWEACCEIVSDYADAVPKWCLNGFSAYEKGECMCDREAWKELEEQPEGTPQHPEGEDEYPQWTMPEPTVTEGFGLQMLSGQLPPGFAIPHVAPDDPCPCGSGLRYRLCHGKYLS